MEFEYSGEMLAVRLLEPSGYYVLMDVSDSSSLIDITTKLTSH